MSHATPSFCPPDFGIGQLFWRIHEAVVVADAVSGRIVLWNPAAEALFGYATSEAVGQLIEILIPEHLRPAHRAGLARFGATGRGAVIGADAALELPAVHKSGRALTIELTLAALEEVPVAGHFVLAIIRDATTRKLAEQQRVQLAAERAARVEAQEAQGRLGFLSAASAILASSLDYEATLDSVARLAVPILGDWCTVYLLDEDGQVRRAAVAYADAAKAPLAAALRRYPPSPVSPHSSVAEAMRTGRPVVTPDIPDRYVEAIAQDPEHLAILRQLAFRVSLAVPLGARGETFGALALFSFDSGRRYDADDLATVEDLARRAGLAIDHARLYREAQRAIRARDEFLSVAAHELRTPITSLLGFAQLVRRQLAGTAPLNPLVADQALAAIDRQSARLRLLIGRLLDVSRLETGRLALDRRPADLVALAAGVVADARVRTGRHALRLEAPEHLVTTVDAVHIEQVLTNLVENAIKYSPAGGTIEVRVRDHGLGIPPERRAHIFDRYYRAHADEQASGIGLGLYISREIVHRHGGELRAEFPEDGGTRFVVVLPVGVQQSHDGGTPTP